VSADPEYVPPPIITVHFEASVEFDGITVDNVPEDDEEKKVFLDVRRA